MTMSNLHKIDPCPGCWNRPHDDLALNSVSRYGHGYICGDCGQKEAIEGDFISKQNEFVRNLLAGR